MNSFNLSAWAIRHQALVLFAIIALGVAGAWSYLHLGRNEDPTFTVKVMVVTAAWPGATAEEMQQQVADRIETKLQTLPWLDQIRTFTRPGFAAMQIVLKDPTPPSEVQELWYQARKKIGDVRQDLPQGVLGPFFNDEYSDVYVAVYMLTGEGARHDTLVDYAEYVRKKFLKVVDVDKVEIFGEQKRKIFIDISYRKLATLGIPPQAIFESLARQNALVPAGTIDTATERVQVRVTGALDGVETVRALPVEAGGKLFRLGDIAEISRGLEDPPGHVVRYNAAPAVGLGVAMAKGANVIDLGKALAVAEKAIQAELPVGIEFTRVSSQPHVVEEAIGEFLLKFAVAVGIVMAVSFLSLGFRTGIIVALSVPLTLAGVFVAMLLLGIDLQRVSLGSLILALGLLVDDAIIAIEMMVVKIEQGFDRAKAATFAWTSTASPMLTGTLVTAAGFIPVGFAKSSSGEYAGGIFWVVVIALVISWLVAVIFIPYLGFKLLPAKMGKHGVGHDPHRTLPYRALRRTLDFAVRRRLLVVASTVGLLLLSAAGMSLVPQQFFPTSTRSELFVEMRGPEGAAFALADREAGKIEAMLAGDPDLEYFTTYVGGGAPRFVLSYNPALPNQNYALILVQTKGGEARERLLHKLRDHFAENEGAVRGRVNRLELGPPVGYAVQFRVVGSEPEELRKIATEVREVMRANKNTRDVEFEWGEKAKTVRLEIDQDRIRLLGLNAQDLAATLQTLISGYEVTALREGTKSVGVVVRAAGPERLDLSRIGDLVVASRNGQAIPVSQVARIAYSAEEPILWRKNRELILTVRSDVAEGLQAPDVTAELIKALKPIEAMLPTGYRLEAGGAYEESGKANSALYSLFPAMILVMLALIMIQMQSFSRMFLVFATFPLGLIGAVLALLLTQQPFGFVALLGVIALGGMIMRNTLILADQIDQDLKAGYTMREAIVESTIRRARPVVLTALAAALAFVPLATNVFWGPLAVALIGGLVVATALTLIALPALYALWFRVPRNAADDKRAPPKTEPVPEGYAVAAE